jgi:hypothetical protein
MFPYCFFFYQALSGRVSLSPQYRGDHKEMMMKKKDVQVMAGALNLLALSLPLLTTPAAHGASAEVTTTAQKVETLNAASLHSIEKSWLAVPNTCKARGFNASPVTLQNRMASAGAQSIYAAFGA